MNCICCYIRKDDWAKSLELCKRISMDSSVRQKMSPFETLRFMYFRCYTMIMAIDSGYQIRAGFDVDRSRKVNEIAMELQDMHKLLQLVHNSQENSKYLEAAVEDFKELVDLFNTTVRTAVAVVQEARVPLQPTDPSTQDNKDDEIVGDKEIDDGVKKVEIGQQLLREGKYKEAYQWHSAAISSQSPHPSKKPELCELLSGRARASAGMGEQKQVSPVPTVQVYIQYAGSCEHSYTLRRQTLTLLARNCCIPAQRKLVTASGPGPPTSRSSELSNFP